MTFLHSKCVVKRRRVASTLKYFLLQLYKREHFVLHIWDIRPIPTIRTTVRIIIRINTHTIQNDCRDRTLLLAAQAKAETLYVTPISETPCTTIVLAESSPCFTLSEYATMSKSLFPSNMSLVLLPGTHSLNNKFSITATHVSITALYASSSSNTNNDTMIDCLEFGSFEFSSNGNVEINGLVLHGCSNTSFTLVDTVRIENCTLLGLPTPSASALVLRSVQDVQIVSTSICLYNVYVPTNSSVYDNLYPQSGSIYISNCTALIFNTVFSGNTALENGAAINIQDSSTVVISNSEKSVFKYEGRCYFRTVKQH